MITPDINLMMPTLKNNEELRAFLEYLKSQKTTFITDLPANIPEEPMLFVLASGDAVEIVVAVNGKYYKTALTEA